MPLKLTCPNCGTPTRVSEPYPLPGVEIQCVGCATAMSVTYPPGVMDLLRKRGKAFQEEQPPAAFGVPSLPPGQPTVPRAAKSSSRPGPVPDGTPPFVSRESDSSGWTPPPADTAPSDRPTELDTPQARRVDLPPEQEPVRRSRRPRPMPSVPAFSTSGPIPETPPRAGRSEEERHGARPTASVEIQRPRAAAPITRLGLRIHVTNCRRAAQAAVRCSLCCDCATATTEVSVSAS